MARSERPRLARLVATILDPRGDPVVLTWNWAPLHLLAHSGLRAVLGTYAETFPHHVVNVLLHAERAPAPFRSAVRAPRG